MLGPLSLNDGPSLSNLGSGSRNRRTTGLRRPAAKNELPEHPGSLQPGRGTRSGKRKRTRRGSHKEGAMRLVAGTLRPGVALAPGRSLQTALSSALTPLQPHATVCHTSCPTRGLLLCPPCGSAVPASVQLSHLLPMGLQLPVPMLPSSPPPAAWPAVCPAPARRPVACPWAARQPPVCP